MRKRPKVHLCCRAAGCIFGTAKTRMPCWIANLQRLCCIAGFLACDVLSNPPDWPGVHCPAFFLLAVQLFPAFCSISALCARSTLRISDAGGRSAIRAMSSASSCHGLPHFIRRTASAMILLRRSAVVAVEGLLAALGCGVAAFAAGAAARAGAFDSGFAAA